jgi:hypothetical protein
LSSGNRIPFLGGDAQAKMESVLGKSFVCDIHYEKTGICKGVVIAETFLVIETGLRVIDNIIYWVDANELPVREFGLIKEGKVFRLEETGYNYEMENHFISGYKENGKQYLCLIFVKCPSCGQPWPLSRILNKV